MNVYKVVRPVDGRLLSSVACEPPFELEYGIGEATYPPEEFPDAWPLAFDDLDDAIRFAARNGGKIYQAEATRTKSVDSLCAIATSASELSTFWSRDDIASRFESYAPAGTVLCSDITLLEEIKPSKLNLIR
jgi:hypothetical protein